ncbi:hypothetical protein DPMN_111819 [Dreissena polymorpha]|uniref:Uncharacterized protein n=1 Tax=Dreissena polymorpha TaxID=45954 RepID=A0A9D4QQB3_DREPO|nr:hypothetical protein DPMN_111819 [Dreissena polymorpha]
MEISRPQYIERSKRLSFNYPTTETSNLGTDKYANRMHKANDPKIAQNMKSMVSKRSTLAEMFLVHAIKSDVANLCQVLDLVTLLKVGHMKVDTVQRIRLSL